MTKAASKGGNNAEATILNYLKRTNRPYSATDLTNNLKDYGKTQIVKSLTSLSQDGSIICKTYGKQQVYVVKQEEGDATVSKEELTELDEQCDRMKEELSKKKAELKERVDLLNNSLLCTLTDEALSERLSAVSAELEKKQQKLQLLLGGGVELVDEKEIKRVEEELKKMNDLLKKRKRMCMDAVKAISEGMDMKVKDFVESVGIEGYE
ncbi:hypothetical protein MP638_001657 [Amoeboaphelidium occidentale]|nr:hypothetical protein MP638_001657 [Amoeboaphelidium occidentale]